MIHRLLVLIFISAFLSKESMAQSFLPNDFHLHRLENGLNVLIIEDPSIPLIHYNMVFRFGAISEDESMNGLAHLYEHMMFTATDSYPSTQQFQHEISKLGIVANALTNEESVHYYFSLTSDNWESGLNLFAEGIINPLFQDEELKLQKAAIRDELNIFASEPYYLLGQLTNKALWGSEYSRKDISGDINTIFKASKDQLYEIQRKHHIPSQALLIIAGNTKKDDVITKVESLFSQWGTAQQQPTPTNNYQFSSLETTKHVLLKNSRVEIPGLLIEWQGPGGNMNDQLAASLFFYALNLKSSQFYIDLNKKDYVYDYFAGIRFGSKSSTLFIEFYPDLKTTDEVIEWLDKQIESWLEHTALSEETLSLAKKKLEIASIFEKEKLSEYVLELGDRWAIGDLALSITYQQKIQEVTMEDVNRIVQRFLNQPRVYGLAIQPEQAKRLHKSIRNKFISK